MAMAPSRNFGAPHVPGAVAAGAPTRSNSFLFLYIYIGNARNDFALIVKGKSLVAAHEFSKLVGDSHALFNSGGNGW